MITQEMIDRINHLAHKKKTIGLTDEELAEQKVLYKEYIAAFRANLKAQLDMIEIVDDEPAGGENANTGNGRPQSRLAVNHNFKPMSLAKPAGGEKS